MPDETNLGVDMLLSENQDMFVFVHIADVADYMADRLKVVPIEMLKAWIRDQRAMADDFTPQQLQMQAFHIEIIEAYIKAREYTQSRVDQQIKNN
jgi:hypothetical protein